MAKKNLGGVGRGGGGVGRGGGGIGGGEGGGECDVQPPGRRLLPGVVEDNVGHLPPANVGRPPLVQPPDCRLLLPAPPSFPPPVLLVLPPPPGLLLLGFHLLLVKVRPGRDHWPCT